MSLIRNIGHSREPAAGRTGILGRLRSGSATPRPQPGGTPATLSGPCIPSGTPRPLSPGRIPRAPYGTLHALQPRRDPLSPSRDPRAQPSCPPTASLRGHQPGGSPAPPKGLPHPSVPAGPPHAPHTVPAHLRPPGAGKGSLAPGTGREETLEAQRQPGLRRRQARRLHQVSGRGRKSKPT